MYISKENYLFNLKIARKTFKLPKYRAKLISKFRIY